MSIDKKYIDYFVNVTSKAALSASYFVGKKDKIAADKAATDTMRSVLNKIEMSGKIECNSRTLHSFMSTNWRVDDSFLSFWGVFTI